ncbi:MAG TPA: substrate-binding domain-containing protein [Ktedonobacteraceae bacterium]
MLLLFFLADLGDPASQFWIGVGSLLLSALAIVITIIVTVRGRQKKLLTHEVVSNSSVINVDNDVGEDLKLLLEGKVVTKVRLHVIKLFNAGNTAIAPEDYPNKLSFEFDSPPYQEPLIRCAIHRTEPETLLPPPKLKNMLAIDDAPAQKVMTLEPPLLNPRQAIFLKVLLLADHRDSTTMIVRGQIKDGEVRKYTPPAVSLTRRVVVTGIAVAFVLGLLISSSIGLITAFIQGSCALGSIQVSGSTSFASTAALEAQGYNKSCPGLIARIAVSESSSGTGMSALENGSIQVADSELVSPYQDLVDNKVAAIVFALVLNKQVGSLGNPSAGFSNLSTADVRRIYGGAATDWYQIDPSLGHLPIRIIGRAESSGTRAAFVRYLMGGNAASLPPGAVIVNSSTEVVSTVANTPGAIGYADLGDANPALVTILDIDRNAPTIPLIEKGAYPFWAIEHMYTHQNPDLLTVSFIAYIKQNLQTSSTFIRLIDIDSTALALHS